MKRLVIICTLLAVCAACATFKNIARTVDDLGDVACNIFGVESPEEFEHLVRSVLPPGAMGDAEKSGFDPRVLCKIKEVVQPFIDDQLRLQESTRVSLSK